jgi:AcrR family transcriptional regulator
MDAVDLPRIAAADGPAAPRASRRGPYGKSASTREAILRAASGALQTYGYRGASLRKIGALAGIDQSSIMHYFSSKEDLILAVVQEAEIRAADFSSAHRPRGLASVPISMIDLARENTDNSGAILTFAVLEAEATATDHPLHDYFRERGERRRAGLATWFRLAGEAGLVRPGVDPDLAAGSFLALWQGIEIQWLNAPAGLDVVRHLEHFFSLVLVDDWESRVDALGSN